MLPMRRDSEREDLEAAKTQAVRPLLDHTVLVRKYRNAEAAASRIFADLVAAGRLAYIGGGLSFDGEPKGEPELMRDLEGNLFPIRAVFDVEMPQGVWRCEFEPSFGDFCVRIHCRAEQMEAIERILDAPVAHRLSVHHAYPKEESVRRLFEDLRAQAQCMRFLPMELGRLAEVELGSKGITPTKLRAEMQWNGESMTISFERRLLHGSHEVVVDCDAKLLGQVEALLRRHDIVERTGTEGAVASVDREVPVERCGWEDLGGMEAVRRELAERIEYPLRHAALAERLQLRLPRGVLLVGPPGCGKTRIAKVLANETGSAFLIASARDLLSKWYGESERNLGRLFDRAREISRTGRATLIFIDEIDGLFADREEMNEIARRTFSQLLSEMDGLEETNNVVVLAATNREQDLDAALVRPGRFDLRIEIALPDEMGRREILQIHLRDRPVSDSARLQDLARRTKGYSGAELESLCSQASFLALRRLLENEGVGIDRIDPEKVSQLRLEDRDFEEALRGRRGKRRSRSSPRRRRGPG